MPAAKRDRSLRGLTFRYHGNYCGPNWSAGKYQGSVAGSSVPAVDEFDQTCLEHDASYFYGKGLKEADYKFFKQNIGRGVKRSIAALAVGLQGYLRKEDDLKNFDSEVMPVVKRRKLGKKKAIMKKPKKSMLKRGKRKRIFKKKKMYRKRYVKRRYSKMKIGRGSVGIASKTGVQVVEEYRNSISGADSVLISHGIGGGYIFRYFIYAIYKALFDKAGIVIRNWHEKVDDDVIVPHTWEVQVYTRQVDNPSVVGTDIQRNVYTWNNTDSHNVFAFNIYNGLIGALFPPNVTGEKKPTILRVELVTYDLEGQNVERRRVASIDLEEAVFIMRYKQRLTMQNRTKHKDGDAQLETTDVVDRAPLKGMVYRSKKWQDKVAIVKNDSDVNPTGIRPSIVLDAENHGRYTAANLLDPTVAGDFNQFRKLVSPWVFGKGYKGTPFVLGPGAIGQNTVYYNMKISVANLVRKIQPGWNGLNSCEVGKVEILQFEKQLGVTGDPSISINYQVENYLSCYVTSKKCRTQPLTYTTTEA